MFPYKPIPQAVQDALNEINRLCEEFERAVAANRELEKVGECPEDEPAEKIEIVGLFHTLCKPTVTGHLIQWYTSGFQ